MSPLSSQTIEVRPSKELIDEIFNKIKEEDEHFNNLEYFFRVAGELLLRMYIDEDGWVVISDKDSDETREVFRLVDDTWRKIRRLNNGAANN